LTDVKDRSGAGERVRQARRLSVAESHPPDGCAVVRVAAQAMLVSRLEGVSRKRMKRGARKGG
jgi:hypothetical protein